MLLVEVKMSLIWSYQLNLECEKLYGINDSIFSHEKIALKKKWRRESAQCQRFKRHFNQMHCVHFVWLQSHSQMNNHKETVWRQLGECDCGPCVMMCYDDICLNNSVIKSLLKETKIDK